MPQLVFLPHEELCPDGIVVEADTGTTICDAALQNGIEIEHACEKSCACTTCHVYIREGMDSLNENSDDEDDMLDKAWGLDPDSRLSCQAVVGKTDLVIEIPDISQVVNHALLVSGRSVYNILEQIKPNNSAILTLTGVPVDQSAPDHVGLL